MKTIKRFFILISAMCVLMTGCDKPLLEASEPTPVLDTATIEIRQNDYRGGISRTYALQGSILSIMEEMKRNNIVVREDNPNSYWTVNGYQDFVSTFLTSPIINDTQWFNEEETDWNTLVAQMGSVPNSFTQTSDNGYTFKSGIYVERNEKDDYSIYGTTASIGSDSGKSSYRILYDCDKDWCKAFSTVEISGSGVSNITSQLFEYARISNDIFAIQTSTERLLVVLESTAKDTDLRERSVKEFYYSRLSGGQRTTFVPYEPLPEYDDYDTPLRDNQRQNELRARYPLLNEEGEVATQYGLSNSIFKQENVSETNYPWVFEDGALQQAIVYKQGTLVVTTYNKLSEKYERFIYSTDKVDDKLISEIEQMVNIEGLVGVVEVNTSEGTGVTNETQSDISTTAQTTTTVSSLQPSEPIETDGNTLSTSSAFSSSTSDNTLPTAETTASTTTNTSLTTATTSSSNIPSDIPETINNESIGGNE